ncbi:PepSY domain-containing protein [Shewanella sp. AS1]|uniref:PepSY-associated TM helix domain-containing protein n=1 Tax=Shewanella sp. AS1 TaxID=2907626 RepID=UPI001F3055F5|nr:PepSY-associated TM helix domain-containing protein [Shewanella sp. AS1]MCE9677717.1 PepSY domain-containing protein [Shewanella sp. AS1]
MTNKPRHPHHKPLWQKFAKFSRPWHRRLGIVSAILVILVSLTGIMINHSHSLGLGAKPVRQAWLLDHYGIKAPENIKLFNLTPLIAASHGQLWIDDKLVLEADNPILAVAQYQQQYLAIDRHHLYLIAKDGQLLERQSQETGLPDKLLSLGLVSHDDKTQVWLNSEQGHYLADPELIDWQVDTPPAGLSWLSPLDSDSAKLTKTQVSAQEQVSLNVRSSYLNWERVLLDLHSGRIFGLSGTLVFDLVALSLIFMAISGFYLWQQTKPKKRGKND